MSMASDYLVEVRDVNFTRLGQIAPEFLDIMFIEGFRGVGSWQLKLPAEHPLLPALKTKGAGIVITHRPSGYVYSGRMQNALLSQDATDPDGTWVISGKDDNLIAAATLVYPDPANAANLQTVAYWVTSGPGETVMRNAVKLNAGASAIAARQYSWLTVAASAGTGTSVSTSARFDVLGDLLTSIGIKANLGWRFAASGAGVAFTTYQPADKTALIQLDIRNGGLESTKLGYSAPSATEVLVLGQGEGASRTVRRVTTTTSVTEAAAWGLRWEVSKDQRNTDVTAELDAAGTEILTDAGTTLHSLKVVPLDSPNQRLGIDWGLGDKVTVVIDGTPAQAIVTEIATSIGSAGVLRTATVGDPIGFDWEAKVSSSIRAQDTRLSALENLVDTGISWASVTGKPTVFYTLPGRLQPTNIQVAGANPDTLTDTGWYSASAWAGSLAGYSIGTLQVVQYSPDWITQTFITAAATPTILTRARYSGTAWSPWVATITTGTPSNPVGLIRRTTTALTISSGVYTNLSANAYWGSGELQGGVTYSNGFIVPTAGLYRVEWAALSSTGTSGIMGIAMNASGTPGGQDLHAIGPLAANGATIGNGSAMVRLPASALLTLWGYGNGGAIAINALANTTTHWGVSWVSA